MENSNAFWAFVSWLTSVISPMALLASADTPLWMFFVASVLVPLTVGFGGKFIDAWFQARREKKKELERRDGQ